MTLDLIVQARIQAVSLYLAQCTQKLGVACRRTAHVPESVWFMRKT